MMIPRDTTNTPIYGGLGLPVFSEAVTLTTTAYTLVFTMPTTGINTSRAWRNIVIRNPSTIRTVYICFGNGSCATDMLKIPPLLGIDIDATLFGSFINYPQVWGRLDVAGSVTPEVTAW